jgi:hypothetical protein
MRFYSAPAMHLLSAVDILWWAILTSAAWVGHAATSVVVAAVG